MLEVLEALLGVPDQGRDSRLVGGVEALPDMSPVETIVDDGTDDIGEGPSAG
jgi:hypothetical protein